MTNKTVLMIGIAAAISLVGILAFSPIHNAIATITDNQPPQCPDGSQIQHWDKIIFVVMHDASKVLGPNSVGKQFDLIVPSQPGVVYDLENVTLTAIENQINPTHDPHIRHKAVGIQIVDVKYDATSCGTTTIQGPQGPPGDGLTCQNQQAIAAAVPNFQISSTCQTQTCNGNGVILNGKCFCNPGFTGTSCETPTP